MSIASAVGAETATMTGAPMVAAFCTISTEIRLDSRTSPSAAGTAGAGQRTGQLVQGVVPADILPQRDQAPFGGPEGGGVDGAGGGIQRLRGGHGLHGRPGSSPA